ncbi:MAG: tetratricopeptide repeat protein [Candidatus Neomarinimicrobiota bacterium]
MNPKKIAVIFALALIGMFFLDACDPPEITSAKVYFQQNNPVAAEEQLLLAIKKYPENSQAYLLLATMIYRPAKRYDEAKQMLESVKRLDPTKEKETNDVIKGMWAEIHTDGATMFNSALKAFLPMEKDSLLGVAAQIFVHAIDFKSDETLTYNGLIKCYYILNDSANVEKYGKMMLDKNLFDKDVVNYYFQVIWKPSRQDEIFAQLDQLIAAHPDVIDLQIIKIQFLAQVNRNEEALSSTNILLEKDPYNLDIIYIAAQLLTKLGKFEDAKYQYQKVVASDPTNLELLTRVTEAVFKNKDWLESEDYARKIIELDANSTFGYEVLWKSLYNQGKLEEAEKYRQIQKSLE